MNLLTAIQSYPGKTAQEVFDALSADTIIATNSTPQSLAGVAECLAEQGVDPMILIGLRGLIRNFPIGGDTLEGLLLTGGGSAGGVNFALPSVRFQIQANQQHPSTSSDQRAILAGLLLIGETPGKQWQLLGLPALPALEEIRALLDSNAVAREWWAHIRDDVVPSMLTTGNSIAEIKSAIGGVE